MFCFFFFPLSILNNNSPVPLVYKGVWVLLSQHHCAPYYSKATFQEGLVIFMIIAGKPSCNLWRKIIATPQKHSGQEGKNNLCKITYEGTILGGLVLIPLVIGNFCMQHGKFTAIIICLGCNFPKEQKKENQNFFKWVVFTWCFRI